MNHLNMKLAGFTVLGKAMTLEIDDSVVDSQSCHLWRYLSEEYTTLSPNFLNL